MADPLLPKPRHHTKDKGDLGVACVIADLAKHGIDVALPLSEHLPFDLIAISADFGLAKIQVKYLSMRTNGTVQVPGRSNWTDRHGTHRRSHRPEEYDSVAVYCPDTDRCYYLPASEVQGRDKVLRILETRNCQRLRVRMADSFTDPFRVFSQAPVAQRIEQQASTLPAGSSNLSGGAEQS